MNPPLLFRLRLLVKRPWCWLTEHKTGRLSKHANASITTGEVCVRCGLGEVREYRGAYPLPRQTVARPTTR